MKTHPAPNVPGSTEWERFDNAVSKFLSVPKEAFAKADIKWRKAQAKKRAKAKAKKPA